MSELGLLPRQTIERGIVAGGENDRGCQTHQGAVSRRSRGRGAGKRLSRANKPPERTGCRSADIEVSPDWTVLATLPPAHEPVHHVDRIEA
jgi:hypothetical protein